jgi:hypothetical protein
MKKILTIFLILFSLSMAYMASASDATLFIEPAQGTYHAGDNLSLKIKINSDGTTMNAASANIKFPTDLMSVQSVSKLGSIFQLWPDEPSFSNPNGTIFFGGGVPAPGFNGIDTILVVNFRIKNAGTANVTISDGQVLAADGRGTDILSFLKGGTYIFLPALPPPIQENPPVETPATTTKPSSIIPPPEIIVYPKYYTSSQELFYVEGKAVPNSVVLIYLKKDDNIYKSWETQSDQNGDWIFSTQEIMRKGQYILTARTKISTGDMSGLSTGYRVNVNLPGIWIGSFVLLYSTLSIAAIIFVILISLMIFFIIFYKAKKAKSRLKKEIKEAKESLEKTFIEIGKKLTKKIEYLDSKPGLNAQEKQLRDEIFYILKNSEEIVSKEIDDIKKELNK